MGSCPEQSVAAFCQPLGRGPGNSMAPPSGFGKAQSEQAPAWLLDTPKTRAFASERTEKTRRSENRRVSGKPAHRLWSPWAQYPVGPCPPCDCGHSASTKAWDMPASSEVGGPTQQDTVVPGGGCGCAEAHGGLGRGAGQYGLPEEEGPHSGPACGSVGGCVALSTHTPLYSPQPTLQKQKPRYRADGPWGR